MLSGRFQHNNYLIRRKVFKLFGGAFHVYDPAGQVVLFASMKAFKLKEDIRLYDNEEKHAELLLIQARRVLDFSAEYDVTDSQTGEKVGVLKRKPADIPGKRSGRGGIRRVGNREREGERARLHRASGKIRESGRQHSNGFAWRLQRDSRREIA